MRLPGRELRPKIPDIRISTGKSPPIRLDQQAGRAESFLVFRPEVMFDQISQLIKNRPHRSILSQSEEIGSVVPEDAAVLVFGQGHFEHAVDLRL